MTHKHISTKNAAKTASRNGPVSNADSGAAGQASQIITVRDSTAADMRAAMRIYAYEVMNNTATFEEIPPNIAEMKRRRQQIIRRGFPYLVAESGDIIAGYAYAAPYHQRSAYRYTAECTVYVASDMHRRGVGTMLMRQLIARCQAGPWRQLIYVVGGRNNVASIALAESLGFEHCGGIKSAGYKFGQWLDTVIMQRAIGLDRPPCGGADTEPAGKPGGPSAG